MPRRKNQNEDSPKRRNPPPGKTMEARENQLIALATNVAEKQMREGTASAQVIAHFLKLGSMKDRLEVEKLKKETELLQAKSESLKTSQKLEELYIKAFNAMRVYSGNPTSDSDGGEDIEDDNS